MTKNPNNDHVGDTKSPALRPHAKGLNPMNEYAERLSAEAAPKSRRRAPIVDLASKSTTQRSNSVAVHTCTQSLWFSFFFDGTGNNLSVDELTSKHSNVAKLYRAHAEDDEGSGTYRIYIPGVGTYFKEVGDDGASALGLGTGKYGEERIAWAIKQFDELLAPHIKRANNESNKILNINLAAFGFSRGAALAGPS